jgi:hypothetical protein
LTAGQQALIKKKGMLDCERKATSHKWEKAGLAIKLMFHRKVPDFVAHGHWSGFAAEFGMAIRKGVYLCMQQDETGIHFDLVKGSDALNQPRPFIEVNDSVTVFFPLLEPLDLSVSTMIKIIPWQAEYFLCARHNVWKRKQRKRRKLKYVGHVLMK